MRRYISRRFARAPMAKRTPVKNWEYNIDGVSIEPCSFEEDPFGYKAVFHLDPTAWKELDKSSYTIGVSLLPQRVVQLEKAGYKAPMTSRAIELAEDVLGRKLLSFDFKQLTNV